MRRKLVAGNWKMNGLRAALSEFDAVAPCLSNPSRSAEVLICPPATLVANAVQSAPEGLAIGGQDCHAAQSGAHTGDISADMLADAGASYVILGHSERRADHNEDDVAIRDKAKSAWQAGLTAIICVGETLAQRDAANTLDIIGGQLASSVPDTATSENLVIAYEPVWAIGTGKVPTLDQIGEVHDFIRTRLERRFGEGVGRTTRILYGGSVKGSNAKEIFAVSNVDGALVGGASLKASDFIPIIEAAG